MQCGNPNKPSQAKTKQTKPTLRFGLRLTLRLTLMLRLRLRLTLRLRLRLRLRFRFRLRLRLRLRERGRGGERESGRGGEACDYFFECSQESKPGQTKTRHSKEIKTKGDKTRERVRI